jgi:hypothetical protein
LPFARVIFGLLELLHQSLTQTIIKEGEVRILWANAKVSKSWNIASKGKEFGVRKALAFPADRMRNLSKA